ncbi:EF-hand domain-containing protein [Consotaella aegiceratis]|uniref:EF-hand domain-containing protein n=1 Tax=Consotaella aegiceratis TaxID=3097961 RepID=UPI002F41F493
MKRIVLGVAALAAAAVVVPAVAQPFGYGWNSNAGQGWVQNGYGPGAMMGFGRSGAMMGRGGPGHAAMMGSGWGGPMMGRGGQGAGTMMGWTETMRPGAGRFMTVDADQDGIVTAEEAASAADQVFAAMDADDDGNLTRDEYMAVRMGPQTGWNQVRQSERQTSKADRFDALDTDHDEQLSRDEFIGGSQAHFEAADGDKDGRVTPWEFRRSAWN